MAPIRIVHIITGLSTGGAEMMLLKLHRSLDSRFQSTVITLIPGGELESQFQQLGIPVHTLGMTRGSPSISAFFRLLSMLRKQRPDIVHTWMYHADLLGGIVARFASVPAIAWCIRQSNLEKEQNSRLTRTIIRLCALFSRIIPNKILTCSAAAVDAHVDVGYTRKKFEIISNGFDLKAFHPNRAAGIEKRKTLGLSETDLVVGMVGRFDTQKNQLGFIDAAKHLSSILSGVKFVMIGRGVDQSNIALLERIRLYGLTNQFLLLGSRQDIPDLMNVLDVFALPSDGEGFPNVLGEAMACGLPCVVTDVGDSAYIVGSTGRIVPRGEMVEFANAVADLLSLPAEERARLGNLSRDRVRDLFEISSIVKKYESFYDNLIKDESDRK